MGKYRLIPISISVLLLIPIAAQSATSKKADNSKHSSAASSAERLGAAESWTAYAYEDKSGKVCYLIGDLQKTERARSKGKRAVAMVTHRPGEKATNVVSFVKGYPLKEGSDATLDIGGTKYDLFTKGDTAWARTSELDKAIVDAMMKGKQASVKATPVKGPSTTDTYSLAGFSEALTLIDKACEVRR
ncbi:MAG: invasion associated locus B family protein [Stellaceae bacterium]